MIASVTIAGLLALGVPLPLTAVVALAFLHPGLFLFGVLVWAVWHAQRRRPRPGRREEREARLLRSIAAELGRGASLRSAVAEVGAESAEVQAAARLAGAGSPPAVVAHRLAAALPVNGRLVAACYVMATDLGAPAAELFERLAGRADARAEAVREARTATAQARSSAVVVSGAPVIVVMLLAGAGRLGGLLEAGGTGIAVVAVGGGLLAAGAVAALLTTRQALR